MISSTIEIIVESNVKSQLLLLLSCRELIITGFISGSFHAMVVLTAGN